MLDMVELQIEKFVSADELKVFLDFRIHFAYNLRLVELQQAQSLALFYKVFYLSQIRHFNVLLI